MMIVAILLTLILCAVLWPAGTRSFIAGIICLVLVLIIFGLYKSGEPVTSATMSRSAPAQTDCELWSKGLLKVEWARQQCEGKGNAPVPSSRKGT